MESTAESTRRELDQDKLRLAPKRYKEAFLSFRCEQHVIDDLEKCYKALSYSITQFHKVGKFFFVQRQKLTALKKKSLFL